MGASNWEVSWDLGLELAHCSFCLILLSKLCHWGRKSFTCRAEHQGHMTKQGCREEWRAGAIITMYHVPQHWTNHPTGRDAGLEALPTCFLSSTPFLLVTEYLHLTRPLKAISSPLSLGSPSWQPQVLCPLCPQDPLRTGTEGPQGTGQMQIQMQDFSAPKWISDKCLWTTQVNKWMKCN